MHFAVTLAVKTGDADAGMGVYSAAWAHNLPFVPVAEERYEIALRARHRDDTIAGVQDRTETTRGVRYPRDRYAVDSQEKNPAIFVPDTFIRRACTYPYLRELFRRVHREARISLI